MGKIKHEKVYLIAYRDRGQQFIYGTGGYTKELFKPIVYSLLQSAERRYMKEVQLTRGNDPITLESINSVPADSRNAYLDYLLNSRPACVGIVKADFQEIMDAWIQYPSQLTPSMIGGLKDVKKAHVTLRGDFIEMFRVYDIGLNINSMLSYYESGILERCY